MPTPRPGGRLLPVVSGLLLSLAFPPLHLLIPAFVGLVPLAVWIARLPEGREGRRAAARGGAVFGTVYFGIVLYWILVALIWFSKLAVLAYLATVVILAGLMALVCYTLFRSHRELGVPLWLALPVAWTFGEWFRAHLPQQLAFPWLGLGTSLTGYPELVGSAELVGARGITFWVAMTNGLLAALILATERRRRAGIAAALAVWVLVPAGWGIWRANTLEVRPAARVAVVQPNISEQTRVDREEGMDSAWAALEQILPAIEPGSVDLVVLPEVTIQDFPLARPRIQDRMQRYSRDLAAPILFGAYGYEFIDDETAITFNSAFLARSDRLADYQYDKRFLVPVVERVPILSPSWFGDLRYFGGLGVGQGWPLAEVAGVAYGALICYESSYPEGSRRFRQEGADVLVNITNDSWYGRQPWWARTTALWQHPSHMVMRAIENRVGVARAANTGISMFIDPVGRTYSTLGLFQRGFRSDQVYTTDVVTLYTRTGDLVGSGSAMAALILLISAWVSARRKAPASALEAD